MFKKFFHKKKSRIDPDYLRNIIFGAEDSLVSTVGVLFGLASAGEYSPRQLILAGFVLTSVEALSMGVGSYLSETEVHERDPKNHKDNTIIGGLLMFLSYFTAGIIVISPYIFLEPSIARFYSVLTSVVLLYVTGYIPSRNFKSGLRMMLVAGGAILVGYFVATIFESR